MSSTGKRTYRAVYRNHQLTLEDPVEFPEGTRFDLIPLFVDHEVVVKGHVIIAGFGLAGRHVADLIEATGLRYTVIEQNPVTVETQRALGRSIILGDVTDPDTLIRAGVHDADILALTIPNEDAVLAGTSLARRLRPDIYIIARTFYSSKGMRASQLGADEVVKAEQAVALQFYDKLRLRLAKKTAEPSA